MPKDTATLVDVIDALVSLGGEADSHDIKKKVIAKRGNILPDGYSYWSSYEKSIDQVIHFHCSQCAKFKGAEYFVQVSRGRYRLASRPR
jgi:hypothetical protein